MIKLEPRLVSFNFTTRVIAPNDLSEDELVKIAKKQIIDNRLGDIEETLNPLRKIRKNQLQIKKRKNG